MLTDDPGGAAVLCFLVHSLEMKSHKNDSHWVYSKASKWPHQVRKESALHHDIHMVLRDTGHLHWPQERT